MNDSEHEEFWVEAGSCQAILAAGAQVLRRPSLQSVAVFVDEAFHALTDNIDPIANSEWRFRLCQWAHKEDGNE